MEKAKKNNTNKSIISEIKEEFRRHMGTLMEQMRKEVKTVGEGHSSLSGKIDKIGSEVEIVKSEVGSVKSELQSVKMAVMDTNQTVKSIEKKLDNHETRILKLEEKVHA